MFKKMLPFLAVSMALVVSSCSTDDADDTTDGTSYTNCFNVVTEIGTNNQTVTQRPTYSISYNITKGTAIVVMNNIMSNPDGTILNLTLNDLPWDVVNGWRVIKASNIKAGGHVVDDLNLGFLSRTNPFGGVVFAVSYKLDNKYQIVTLPTQINYYGVTQVQNSGDSTTEPYTNSTPQYLVSLNPETMTAVLELRQAKFAPQMPAMDLKFVGLPFTATNNGYIIRQGDEPLIPQDAQGVPNPSFPITGTLVNAVMGGAVSLQFNCTAGKLGDYTVKAQLEYLPTY